MCSFGSDDSKVCCGRQSGCIALADCSSVLFTLVTVCRLLTIDLSDRMHAVAPAVQRLQTSIDTPLRTLLLTLPLNTAT